MKNTFSFNHNDSVIVNGSGLGLATNVRAKVKGVATTEFPIMGRNYILECVDGTFPSKFYPFSTFVAFENHMTLDTTNEEAR